MPGALSGEPLKLGKLSLEIGVPVREAVHREDMRARSLCCPWKETIPPVLGGLSLLLSLTPGSSLAPNSLGISAIVALPCETRDRVSWPGQLAVHSLCGGPFEPTSWPGCLEGGDVSYEDY